MGLPGLEKRDARSARRCHLLSVSVGIAAGFLATHARLSPVTNPVKLRKMHSPPRLRRGKGEELGKGSKR